LPCLPRECVTGQDWDELCWLHERVLAGEREPALVAAFPFDQIGARAPWRWRGAARGMYANLLATIAG
jgi:homoserine O-succinyltransferase/O-acetyltransferase